MADPMVSLTPHDPPHFAPHTAPGRTLNLVRAHSAAYPPITSLATIGDSLTSEGNSIVSGDGTNWWAGCWPAHLRTALGHRIQFEMNPATNRYTFAVSGAQSNDFLTGGTYRSYFLNALASDADTLAVFIGANDLSNGRTASAATTDIIALWDEAIAADKQVLAFEIIGVRSTHPVAATFRTKQVACNALLRAAASSRGIQIIRWGNELDDDGDGFSDDKYLYDIVHTNMLGGTTLANFVAQRLASRVTGESYFSWPVENAGAWVTPNAYPTGTPGSNQTATGWTVNAGGNVSVAKNLIARTDGVAGCWQEIVASGSVDGAVLIANPTDLAQAYTQATGSFVTGDRVVAAVEYEAADALWGVQTSLEITSQRGGDHLHGGQLGSMVEKLPAHSGILWTAPYTWTSGTAAQVVTRFFGNGTVRLGRMGIYKVGAATGFNPLAYANLTGWFDASDANSLFDATSGGSLVAADGAVARWVNKVGRGEPAIQATANARPVRKAAAVNGLDILRFDGSNDALASGSFGKSNSVGCFIAAFLDTKVSSRSYQTVMSFGSNGASLGAATTDYNYGLGQPGQYAPVATQAVAPSTMTVVAVRWNGSAASVFVNGVKTTATLPGPAFNSNDALFFGQHNTAGFSWFGGDICEAFAFNAAPSDADIAAFTSYLTDKWT